MYSEFQKMVSEAAVVYL